MGLRCIIGHDYGEPDRTETREDRGDERVVTVREYRECRRCGHQQVISENTEVRPTEDTTTEPDDEDEADPDTDAAGEADAAESEYEDVDAEEDDGVILDEEEEVDPEPERDPGEWPDSDEEAEEPDEHDEWPDDHREKTAGGPEDEHDDWPTTDAADEGFDAEPTSGGPGEDVDFGGGLAPEDAGAGMDAGETAVEDAGGADAEPTASGIRRSEPGPSPTTQQRTADPETVFVCPNCDETAPAYESSLRPGDICPECGRGYLTEREES